MGRKRPSPRIHHNFRMGTKPNSDRAASSIRRTKRVCIARALLKTEDTDSDDSTSWAPQPSKDQEASERLKGQQDNNRSGFRLSTRTGLSSSVMAELLGTHEELMRSCKPIPRYIARKMAGRWRHHESYQPREKRIITKKIWK